jgi:serine/threonine protein kinase
MIDRIPEIREEIYRSERTIISRGVHPERGEWIVKQFQGDDRSMGVSTRFHNEDRVQTLLTGQDDSGAFEKNGQRLLVRRYYPGRSLETLIRENKLTLDQKLTLFIAASKGLRPIHALHLVHKDISPGNLIVASDPSQVSWIDFELSTDLSVPNRILQG